MAKITIGSTIIGKSGKKLIVDRVEGDIIHSGELKIIASAVVEVIPPPKPKTRKLVLDDRVRYIGTHPNFREQYGGDRVLEIWAIGKAGDDDKCACLTPDGRVSTWIEYSDLELATDDTTSPLNTVTQPPRRISIGDEVTIRSTQQRGRIAIWYRNRSKSVIELEYDTLSDWVPSSDLVRISDGAIEDMPDEPLPPLAANWKPTLSPFDDEGDGLMEGE
jgi:hypothetical protein